MHFMPCKASAMLSLVSAAAIQNPAVFADFNDDDYKVPQPNPKKRS